MYCSKCGSYLIESTDPINTVFRDTPITIVDVRHYACSKCGEAEIRAEELDRYSSQLARKYREKTGLLLPQDIKSLRKKYGLTQAEFEKVFGVTSPTCSRWEKGRAIPTLPTNKLLTEAIENPVTMQRLMAKEGVVPREKRGTIVSLPKKSKREVAKEA